MVFAVKGTEGRDYLESITKVLKLLLSKRKIDALLVPKRYPNGKNVAQVLITETQKLDGSDPLAPVQMVNAAGIVKELAKEPVSKKIAAVLRPCEVRATIELIKLKQVADENLILIGYDCPGVYNIKEYMRLIEKQEDKEAHTLQHVKEFLSGDKDTIRESCRECIFFTGSSADINIAWIGADEPSIFIEAITDKGVHLFDDIETGKIDDLPARKRMLEKILVERTRRQKTTLDGFFDLLQPCIRCYNCREVCPLCYCKECLLKPEKMGYSSERYLSRAEKKQQIKMPVDTVLYHLTKVNHMGFSCVSCGVCEQACPMEIPLGRIHKIFSRNIQALFDYVPGRSRDEELPILTFKEEELADVEDIGMKGKLLE
jgi:formate dehydrogenase subunit beta